MLKLRYFLLSMIPSLLIFLLALEVTSYLGLFFTNNLTEGSFLSEYRDVNSNPKSKLDKVYQTGWAAIRPHPYFGYVQSGGNNHGFDGQLDIPYLKKKNEYVIGIFGGSVAWSFGSSRAIESLSQELKSKVKALQNKEIKIFNMSMGAYKQPQTYFVSTYFAEMFDLVINLDGWNEIQPRSYHQTGGRYQPKIEVPESFPAFAEIFFSKDQETYLALGQSIYLSKVVKGFANYLEDSYVLQKSAFIYLSWRLLNTVLKNGRIKEKSFEAYSKIDKENLSGKRDKIKARVELWERYVRLQDAALKSMGVKTVFFIQPNHHYRNTKPLAVGEPYHPRQVNFVNESYDRLASKVPKLLRSNIQVFDLFDVFQNEPRTIYVDDCHVNALGNQLMGQRITKKLLKHSAAIFSQ